MVNRLFSYRKNIFLRRYIDDSHIDCSVIHIHWIYRRLIKQKSLRVLLLSFFSYGNVAILGDLRQSTLWAVVPKYSSIKQRGVSSHSDCIDETTAHCGEMDVKNPVGMDFLGIRNTSQDRKCLSNRLLRPFFLFYLSNMNLYHSSAEVLWKENRFFQRLSCLFPRTILVYHSAYSLQTSDAITPREGTRFK